MALMKPNGSSSPSLKVNFQKTERNKKIYLTCMLTETTFSNTKDFYAKENPTFKQT